MTVENRGFRTRTGVHARLQYTVIGFDDLREYHDDRGRRLKRTVTRIQDLEGVHFDSLCVGIGPTIEDGPGVR